VVHASWSSRSSEEQSETVSMLYLISEVIDGEARVDLLTIETNEAHVTRACSSSADETTRHPYGT
jgi:hypothetical protein